MNRIVPLLRIAAATALIATAGCDLLAIDSDHTEVIVEIDSGDGSQVLIITSQLFTVWIDENGREDVTLHQVDSIWVTPFFQGTYDVNAAEEDVTGFFVRAAEAQNPETPVSMRVLVDGEESYSDTKVLTGSGLRFYFQR